MDKVVDVCDVAEALLDLLVCEVGVALVAEESCVVEVELPRVRSTDDEVSVAIVLQDERLEEELGAKQAVVAEEIDGAGSP